MCLGQVSLTVFIVSQAGFEVNSRSQSLLLFTGSRIRWRPRSPPCYAIEHITELVKIHTLLPISASGKWTKKNEVRIWTWHAESIFCAKYRHTTHTFDSLIFICYAYFFSTQGPQLRTCLLFSITKVSTYLTYGCFMDEIVTYFCHCSSQVSS